jgi:hypothetical protein
VTRQQVSTKPRPHSARGDSWGAIAVQCGTKCTAEQQRSPAALMRETLIHSSTHTRTHEGTSRAREAGARTHRDKTRRPPLGPLFCGASGDCFWRLCSSNHTLQEGQHTHTPQTPADGTGKAPNPSQTRDTAVPALESMAALHGCLAQPPLPCMAALHSNCHAYYTAAMRCRQPEGQGKRGQEHTQHTHPCACSQHDRCPCYESTQPAGRSCTHDPASAHGNTPGTTVAAKQYSARASTTAAGRSSHSP